jgi:radical SAM superfamily enzyme with C-terminal helix-hairpin-helix motif
MKKFLILDCYVDEPTCLGVPPFVSPYPRYVYGALISVGLSPENIIYKTIDCLRENNYNFTEEYDHVLIIGGAAVPGKYLGSRIGTLSEINKILHQNRRTKISIGGSIAPLIKHGDTNISIVKNDIDKFAFTLVQSDPTDKKRTIEESALWSVKGSVIVKQHPWYPNIICEIESGRGCPRQAHCSFCLEGLDKEIEFRKTEDIINEIDALISHGVSRFRIGKQADIIQYGTLLNKYNNGFPQPNKNSVNELFSELKKRKESGKIEVLNIDNANPGSIVNWPDESSAILESIAEAVTPGDTMAFGIESFDESIVKQNNLKVLPDDALFAIRLVNEIGGKRENGIPKLLPGINLIHGLKGETTDTFKINHKYLELIANKGFLIKRINIRKLQPYPGTPIFDANHKIGNAITKRFEYYRDKIRDEIDNSMLKKIYPPGIILKNVCILDSRNGYSIGKQIASYSIAVKTPAVFEKMKFIDAIVMTHRERSIMALPVPFEINSVSQKNFEIIPGISREKASELILKRPFQTTDSFTDELTNVKEDLLMIIKENSLV